MPNASDSRGKDRLMTLMEGYFYLVGKYEFGQSVAVLADEHVRSYEHVDCVIRMMEEYRPDIVAKLQYKAERRRWLVEREQNRQNNKKK